MSIGFWGFWLAVGLVVYVAFVWALVRLAVRADEAGHESREGEHVPSTLTKDTEGSSA